CRAASTMRLHDASKIDARWQRVPVFLVPEITDRQVAILQGQFHVAGKNKWRAYEMAGHLHAMRTELKMDVKSIARALGMQERVAKVLKKDGFKEAFAVVGKLDPTADSVVFRKVKELTDLLRGLTSTELQRVRQERKPQQLLRELATAIKNVARTADFGL